MANGKLSSIKASLTFVFMQAYEEIYPSRIGKLIVEHSFVDGYYLTYLDGRIIREGDAENILAKMHSLLDTEELTEGTLPRPFVMQKLKDSPDVMGVLKAWRIDPVPVIIMGDSTGDNIRFDIRYRSHCVDRDLLKNSFSLQGYRDGLLLRFSSPWRSNGEFRMHIFSDRPKLFDAMQEYEKWGNISGVADISHLNEMVYRSEIFDVLWVSEALHEKKFAEVAASIVSGFPKKRVVCIAGPSSSGKTTAAKRLSIHLKVLGYGALLISMDDYYRDEDQKPDLPDGTKDYDSLHALDIGMICDRAKLLLDGKAVPKREYNFYTHSGVDKRKKLILPEKSFIILEGIHGLNPEFTAKLGGAANIHKIFVSAITQLNIDNHHHFSTADNRLLRRILRDYRTRGETAESTIERWPMVRQSEETHIFPFQEEADQFINTALVYELCILANYVKPLLAEVDGSPHSVVEAERLLRILNIFYPMTEEYVPRNSILREFTGGSGLR